MEGRENCFEAPVTLTPRDDGSLENYFRDPSGIVGECVLSRQDIPTLEDDPEDDGDPRLPSEIMDELGITELPNTGGPTLSPPICGTLLASGVLVATLTRRTR